MKFFLIAVLVALIYKIDLIYYNPWDMSIWNRCHFFFLQVLLFKCCVSFIYSASELLAWGANHFTCCCCCCCCWREIRRRRTLFLFWPIVASAVCGWPIIIRSGLFPLYSVLYSIVIADICFQKSRQPADFQWEWETIKVELKRHILFYFVVVAWPAIWKNNKNRDILFEYTGTKLYTYTTPDNG